MDSVEILGLSCAILTTVLNCPQLYHMVKRKSTKDVSYIFLLLNIINSILWTIYGFFKKNLPIILSDIFIFLTTISMLLVKIYFENVYQQNS